MKLRCYQYHKIIQDAKITNNKKTKWTLAHPQCVHLIQSPPTKLVIFQSIIKKFRNIKNIIYELKNYLNGYFVSPTMKINNYNSIPIKMKRKNIKKSYTKNVHLFVQNYFPNEYLLFSTLSLLVKNVDQKLFIWESIGILEDFYVRKYMLIFMLFSYIHKNLPSHVRNFSFDKVSQNYTFYMTVCVYVQTHMQKNAQKVATIN